MIDKTGTLTEGQPKLVAIETAEGHKELELLRLAASLERDSEHPLANAVVSGAERAACDSQVSKTSGQFPAKACAAGLMDEQWRWKSGAAG